MDKRLCRRRLSTVIRSGADIGVRDVVLRQRQQYHAQRQKIRASKSANEGRYFRGVATTVSYKNMDLSIFYSFKRADGNISITDDKGDAEEITSIQQSGLHRTAGDILDRKAFKQQFYGFNLSYKNEDTQIGYTVHKTDMSATLYPDERIYNIFYFRGKPL